MDLPEYGTKQVALTITPRDRMADPLCVLCGKPVLPTDRKITLQGVTHHMTCWERKQLRGR